MALETLKHLIEINNFKIGKFASYEDKEQKYFIKLSDNNEIFFKIQDGPIKECGVNGCQVDTIIETAKLIIEGLNKKFYCKENQACINHLIFALSSLKQRKIDREKRNVEGENKI